MAAAPQQGNQPDNSAGVLWGIEALFAALGIIWYEFKDYIIVFYLTIKLYEVDLVAAVADSLSRHLNTNPQNVDELRLAVLYALAHPSNISVADLAKIGMAVGSWLRIPIMIFLLILGAVVYLGNIARVFTRTYTMRDLAKLEKENWPQISPVVDLELVKTDIDSGPWAMAMTPLQFCKRYKLLDEVRPERQEGMNRKDWNRIDVVLKRGAATKEFALQLGQLWKGTNSLSPHARALFAVFAARINAVGADATKILAQLSATATTKLDMRSVTEVLKKHENTKLVQQIVGSHAYLLTVMAAMLEGAREDGVQASADFLWLKPLDRRLWYMLNTVGRQTPFVEVAGVFAHWTAEKEAGRKLLVPMVEEASNALELALKEVVYRPDEAQ